MHPLTLTSAVLAAVLLGLAVSMLLPRKRKAEPLPREWRLTLRPVSNANERRMYQQLHEAFPQYVIFCKLPLTRFTQACDRTRVKFWHGLMGQLHVTFAIGTPSGRVIAAIDIEGPNGGSRRATRIKTGVLNACQVRYLCFMVDDLPSCGEIRRAVLQDDTAPDTTPGLGPAPASAGLDEARNSLHSTVRKRREDRDALQWGESRQAIEDSLQPDSFFAPDNRMEALRDSGFAPLREADNDIVGVVIDDPTPRAAAGHG